MLPFLLAPSLALCALAQSAAPSSLLSPPLLSPPLLSEANAVAIARRENRGDRKKQLDTLRAAAAVREARSYYFPQTNINLLAGYSPLPLTFTLPEGSLGVYPATGPIPAQPESISGGNSFNVLTFATFGQPLSELYRVHLGVAAARLQVKLAGEAMRQTDQQLVAQVRESYHQVCLLEAQVSSDTEQEQSLQETVRTAEDAVARGALLAGDLLQAKAALARQHVSCTKDADELLTQREHLNYLLGRDLDTSFSVVPMGLPPVEELDLRTARATALRQRPEIRQAELQAQSANLDVRRKRAEYIPDIDAQVTYLGLQNVQFISPNAVNLGVSLSWQNPWDWGKRKAEISGLHDIAAQRRLTADDARQQVLLDVDQRFRALKEARMAVGAAQLEVDASRETLRVLRNRNQQQAALLRDVLKQTADLQLRNAQYVKALAEFWNAQADFNRALGAE